MPSDLSNVLITLARTFHWASPHYLETLYCDDLDHFGLLFWYNDVERQNKQLDAKTPTI